MKHSRPPPSPPAAFPLLPLAAHPFTVFYRLQSGARQVQARQGSLSLPALPGPRRAPFDLQVESGHNHVSQDVTGPEPLCFMLRLGARGLRAGIGWLGLYLDSSQRNEWVT